MGESREIGIIGSGGQAEEAESYLKDRTAAFRAVDKSYLELGNDNLIDIDSANEKQIDTAVVAAIGAPALRRVLLEKWPGEKYETIISEHAVVDESASIGEGSIVCPRAVITTGVEIGKHSIVNIAATISHDCILGEYVTVSPGVHMGGNVRLGDGVFVGIGAIIKNGISIAEGVVIGAGAVVIKNIDTPNSVHVGVPAKEMSVNDGWLNEV